MPFEFQKTDIEEVMLVIPKVFGDGRGFFVETYKKTDFKNAGICEEFIQDNRSCSKKGVLRGLHYQKEPYAQSKLVHVISGKIFDVALDIRKGSKTFGSWVGVVLSAENKHQLYIPKGFAHGFVTLEDDTEVCYKTSGEYRPDFERGILYSDPTANINWQIDFPPVLSEKDKSQPLLADIQEENLFH